MEVETVEKGLGAVGDGPEAAGEEAEADGKRPGAAVEGLKAVKEAPEADKEETEAIKERPGTAEEGAEAAEKNPGAAGEGAEADGKNPEAAGEGTEADGKKPGAAAEIEVFQAGPEDLPLLMEWRMRVLREVFSIPEGADTAALARANRAYYERHLRENSHTACFAREKGTAGIVGCGGICYQEEMPSPDNTSGLCGYLMNIYTLPAYRGRGVGRKIVEFLIRDAQKRGTEKIYLESSDSGRRLYREMGFAKMRGYMKLQTDILL